MKDLDKPVDAEKAEKPAKAPRKSASKGLEDVVKNLEEIAED